MRRLLFIPLLLMCGILKAEGYTNIGLPQVTNVQVMNNDQILNALVTIGNRISSPTAAAMNVAISSNDVNVGTATRINFNGSALGSVTFFSSNVTVTVNAPEATVQAPSTSSVLNNLFITTNGANTNQFIITVDAIDVMGCYMQNLSTSVFVNVSGLGGSNIGDIASTWYQGWITATTDCSTFSVILDSANVKNPVLPSGYTKYRPIFQFYNDASSNLVPISKRGKYVAMFTHNEIISGVNPTGTETLLDFTNFISPKSYHIYCSMEVVGTNAAMWLRFIGEIPVNFANADFESAGEGMNGGGTLNTHMDFSVHSLRMAYYKEIFACTQFSVAIRGYDEEY